MKISSELRHILGRKGEDAAVRYLEEQDFIILNRNWKTKAGELDIVALDGGYLVFVEVKTRTFRNDLDVYRTVSLRQIRRNRVAAQLYMRIMEEPPQIGRFDLIEIVVSRRGGAMQLSHRVNYQKPLYRRSREFEADADGDVNEEKRFLAPALFLPCPLCGKQHYGKANSFCPECLRKIPFAGKEIRCPDCGEVLDEFELSCKRCQDDGRKHPWDKVLYLMDYSGAAKTLIREFKYSGRVHLARTFAALAVEAFEAHQLTFDAVCAVPMPLLRQLSRSYNQADLLARMISGKLKIRHLKPFSLTLFARPQSRMNMRERASNRKNRFKVKKSALLSGSNILLVDDVYTTGATLEAAAKELKKSGADTITVFTCAHTPRYRKSR
jgi:ComF family protein